MRKANHFQRDGRGVFKCATCDRSTRITHQDRSSPLCYECFECAGYENAVQDGEDLATVQKQIAGYVAEIEKRGGNMKKFYSQFEVLFPDGPVAAAPAPKKQKKGKTKRVRLSSSQMVLLEEIIQTRPPHCNIEDYKTLKSLIENAKIMAVRI